jgi:hypothetical protein
MVQLKTHPSSQDQNLSISVPPPKKLILSGVFVMTNVSHLPAPSFGL